MTPNYKFFFAVSGVFAAAVLVVCSAKAGWLDWVGNPLWVTAVATLALAIGVVVAVDSLNETRRDRHIQILSDFGRRWDTPHLLEARDEQAGIHSSALATLVDRWAKRNATDDEARLVHTLLRVPNFFEDLAIMVDLGDLKIEFVAKAFKSSAEREWAYWREAIELLQKDNASSYKQFQGLADNLAKCEIV